MDETLTWQKHIEETMKKIGSRLALFGRLRKYLTVDSSEVLANSLILPYFDYCSNSICTIFERRFNKTTQENGPVDLKSQLFYSH